MQLVELVLPMLFLLRLLFLAVSQCRFCGENNVTYEQTDMKECRGLEGLGGLLTKAMGEFTVQA